jgi:hypothetical protein
MPGRAGEDVIKFVRQDAGESASRRGIRVQICAPCFRYCWGLALGSGGRAIAFI